MTPGQLAAACRHTVNGPGRSDLDPFYRRTGEKRWKALEGSGLKPGAGGERREAGGWGGGERDRRSQGGRQVRCWTRPPAFGAFAHGCTGARHDPLREGDWAVYGLTIVVRTTIATGGSMSQRGRGSVGTMCRRGGSGTDSAREMVLELMWPNTLLAPPRPAPSCLMHSASGCCTWPALDSGHGGW